MSSKGRHNLEVFLRRPVIRQKAKQQSPKKKMTLPTTITDIPSFIWNILSGLPLIPSSKSVAELWLSRGELGLVVFGAAIIIGIAGEYFAERRAHRRERSWIPSVDQNKHWDWEAIFAFVVVLSVVGEFVSDADIWVTSDALQTISDTEIGSAEQLAETAATEANDAIVKAKEANTTSSTAQERLTQLLEKESDLEKRQSDLLDVLTPPQLEYGQFSTDLRVESVPVIIEAEPDPNSQFFALDLDAAFRQAQWPQRSIVKAPISFLDGIWIKYLYSTNDDSPHKAAEAVCRALSAQLLMNIKVLSAMTLEDAHNFFRRSPSFSEALWATQHRNGPTVFEWPEEVPHGTIIIHVGPNQNNFFFNNARAKKGLRPLNFSQPSSDCR
jgi:hypothetical protein